MNSGSRAVRFTPSDVASATISEAISDLIFATACRRDLRQDVLSRILGLGPGTADDLRGLAPGVGDDLFGFPAGVGHQLVRLGAPLLQPLVVEFPGQFLKFVFHSVI